MFNQFVYYLLFLNLNLILSLNQNDCKCRLKTNSKIVGGHTAAYAKYPWMASIGYFPTSTFFNKTIKECNSKRIYRLLLIIIIIF